MSKNANHVYPILDAMIALKKETISDLMKVANIKMTALSRKINGFCDFTFSEVEQISKHFGLPVDFIFSKDEKPFLDSIQYFLKKEAKN